MSKTFTGNSNDASAPILGAKFFKKGTRLEAVVLRPFETQNGTCYVLLLKDPVKVNGKLEKQVAVGAMAGFKMALNAAGLDELETDDRIILECIGTTETSKGNPRVDFKVAVSRN